MRRTLREIAGAGLAILFATAPTLARTRAPWPDDFVGRLEALALVETLNARLLETRSATAVLEKWCADHHMAAEPEIVVRIAPGVSTPASPEQRARLGVGPDEPVAYRRVALVCGEHVLVEADNWYAPSRLTPEMNHTLQSTDAPFGKVIAPLRPFRRVFSVERRWSPLPDGWENEPREAIAKRIQKGKDLDAPHALFELRVIVHAGDGKPLAEVRETYTNELLDFDAAAARR